MDPAGRAAPQALPETTTVTPTGKATVIPETPPPPSSLALARMRRAPSLPSPALSFPFASLFPCFSESPLHTLSALPARSAHAHSATRLRRLWPSRVRFDRPPRKPDKHISPRTPAPPRCQPGRTAHAWLCTYGARSGTRSRRAARSRRPSPMCSQIPSPGPVGCGEVFASYPFLRPAWAAGSPHVTAWAPAAAEASVGRAAGRPAPAPARPAAS